MYKYVIIILLFITNYSVATDKIYSTTLEEAVLLSESQNKPILVIFSAEWCKPCRRLKDDINFGKYNKELLNTIVCFVDIEDRQDLKQEYQIDTVPDSRILVDRIEKHRINGYNPNKYKQWLMNND